MIRLEEEGDMSETIATACECSRDWPDADAGEQAVLIGSGVALVLAGGAALLRNKPKWIPLWIAGLLAWGTIPKYFICARCENYGKPCDFYYGGRYAAKFFKKQDKPFNAAGYFAEGATLGVFNLLPAIAARRDFKALSLYGLAALLFQGLLIKFCCIDCVRYARDPWKAAYCPTYKLVAGLGLASPGERSVEII